MFHVAHRTFQAILHNPHHLVCHFRLLFVRIHRVGQQHRHLLRGCQAIVVVGQPCENEPLKESPQLSSHLTEIDWRAQHQAIRLSHLFKNRRQGIPELAHVRHLPFQFTSHTRHTAFIVYIIQAYCLHFNLVTHRTGTFCNLSQHGCRVERLAGTAVNNHHLFHRINSVF